MYKDLNETNIKLFTSVTIFSKAINELDWKVYSNDTTYEYYDIIYRISYG